MWRILVDENGDLADVARVLRGTTHFRSCRHNRIQVCCLKLPLKPTFFFHAMWQVEHSTHLVSTNSANHFGRGGSQAAMGVDQSENRTRERREEISMLQTPIQGEATGCRLEHSEAE